MLRLASKRLGIAASCWLGIALVLLQVFLPLLHDPADHHHATHVDVTQEISAEPIDDCPTCATLLAAGPADLPSPAPVTSPVCIQPIEQILYSEPIVIDLVRIRGAPARGPPGI